MASFLYSVATLSLSISFIYYEKYPVAFLFLALYSTERIVDVVREVKR
jgi:hypothetical protein